MAGIEYRERPATSGNQHRPHWAAPLTCRSYGAMTAARARPVEADASLTITLLIPSPAMPYAIGIVLGLVTVLLGRTVGFDRDRAFYPTILIVVAAYYVLFAAMGAPRAVIVETMAGLVFLAVAIVGFRTNLWLIAAALVGHGVFDSFHGRLVSNPGVPTWWPAF